MAAEGGVLKNIHVQLGQARVNLSSYLVDSDISQSHPPEILHLFVGHRGNGVNSSSTIGCNLHTSIAYVQVIPHLVAAIVTMMDLFVTVIVIILQTWLQVVVEVAHTF